jgi:imidazolonepropionase-like amidohydrolase
MILLRAVGLALGIWLLTPSAFAQVIAVRAGRLIDPDRGTASTNQTILVQSGVIIAVGPDLTVPPGAEIVDLSSATVMPGLFDAHTHLCMNVRPERDAGNYYLTSLRDSNAARAIDGVVNARAMLEAGFTTVRDVGNEGNFACTDVRRALEVGRIDGPTMINAGRIITPFGGQFHLQPDRPELVEPEYYVADTHDEMIKAVRENVHYGAMVIKIVVDDQDYIYSTDDIRFIKEEAARAGRRLAAHAWTAEGAHNAAEAGVGSIEHLYSIEDEDLALAKRNGVVAVFTPFPLEEQAVYWNNPTPEVLSADHAHQIDRIRAALRVGIPMAFGTDVMGNLPGYTRGTQALTRLDMFEEAGMTPVQLLRAMTTTAAGLLGVDAVRGRIAPGMAADLIATPGNPLDDVQELKRVFFVMKDGRIIRDDPAPMDPPVPGR